MNERQAKKVALDISQVLIGQELNSTTDLVFDVMREWGFDVTNKNLIKIEQQLERIRSSIRERLYKLEQSDHE